MPHGEKRRINLSVPTNNSELREKMIRMDTETLPTPIKSENDNKVYRYIKLANGLKALLIDATHATAAETSEYSSGEDSDGDDEEEDEDANLVACSLMVDVGSFSDPRNIQGLAHFLEHMIFMGSTKYPAENEYDAFVQRVGGSDNASTDCAETTFYFEVTEAHLEGALDRFSALFVDPLMSRDAMGREREAVHSEFQTKINNDGIRREQILSSLGQADHPCSLFGWGNMETLQENVDDDELYETVHKFRTRHYSAHRMYVCLQARKTLDELQGLVERYFGQIPSNDLPALNFDAFNSKNAFKPEFYSKVYYVKAKSDVNKLELTWVLPSTLDKYRTKPEDFLSHLIGDESVGSLASYLRRKLLAVDVFAGTDASGFESNALYTLFTIAIMLTDKGLAEIECVLAAVFSYLRLLKREDVDEEAYKELQQIAENQFKFKVEKQAVDNVEDYVTCLKYYKPEDVLGGSSLFYEFDASLIRTTIDQLNSPNFNVMISTHNPVNGINYDQKEEWFGTEFGCIDFPQRWRDLWNSSEILPNLHLPHRNEFIATNFEIVSNDEISTYPKRLIDSPKLEVWYRADDKFKLPHSYINVYLKSTIPRTSAQSMASMNLVSLLLRFYIAEKLYPAKDTGIDYQMYSAELGLVFKVNGFSEKIHKVVEIFGRFLRNFCDIIEESTFNVIKAQLKKNYRNSYLSTKQESKDLRLSSIQEYYHSNLKKSSAINDITFDGIKDFSRIFLAHLKIQALIQGNLTENGASVLMEGFCNTLGQFEAEPEIECRAKEIPLGARYLRTKSLRPNDFNTTTTNYYQVGLSSITLTAHLDLLIALMEEPLFDTLRTKEQLGYDLSVSVKDTFGVLGYTITINSQENKHKFTMVDSRIEQFRNNFLVTLSEMPDEDFMIARDSLIQLKSMPDMELSEELLRNWAEVTEKEYIFDRRWKEIDVLKKIQRNDIVKFYEKSLKETRKLSIQVVGVEEVKKIEEKKGDEENVVLEYLPQQNDMECIQDLDKFVASLPLYPVHKTIV